MSKGAPIPLPESGALAWSLENPSAPRDAVALLNKVATAGIAFSDPTSSRGKLAFVIADEDAALVLPLLWNGGVSANVSTYSATAGATYSQAQVQALMAQVSALTNAINAILTAERIWQERTRT